MKDTRDLLFPSSFPAIKRGSLSILQLNLGYLCNLSCTHCHVNAGPKRTELMSRETMDQVLDLAVEQQVQCIDMTGGAPEMNPQFRYLVERASKLGIKLIDRCNLTILLEPGYEDIAEFLAEHKVAISASLPCYTEDNVAEQRGKGVFDGSIEALQQLNRLGYGHDPELQLDLVYNPNGAFLPPPQASLEQEYKSILAAQHGIVFNHLLTITNMPISRFGAVLYAKGEFEQYLQLLKDNFAATNMEALMCRSLISIDWQGYVYDCDFNQMLELPMASMVADSTLIAKEGRTHIKDLLQRDIKGLTIAVAEHCFACTAGQGSSCGGAL